MSKKSTYWLVDEAGIKALVEGADERDRLAPLGWSETTEPAGNDRVWLVHEEHKGGAVFPASIMDVWRQKGWAPGGTPPAVDPLAEASSAVAAPVAAAPPAETVTSAAPAAKNEGK